MRSRHNDLPMWAAQQLHRCVTRGASRPDRRVQDSYELVLCYVHAFERSLTLAHQARVRGWHAAASIVQERAVSSLRSIQSAVAEALALSQPASFPLPLPTLRSVLQELRQLAHEFPRILIEPKRGLIGVTTEPVELDGVSLGPFQIELYLDRLSQRPDVSALDVVALDPHPAASSEDTTHPHIRDNQLCAGDATVPIAAALRDGRVGDAFLAINSVLHHYNPQSAYVSLAEWSGTPCSDCGRSVPEEQRSYCEGCDQDYCDECFGTCEVCDEPRCMGCLEEDRVSGRSCCRGCRRRCGGCGRTVDIEDFVEETGLCPECEEERQEEEDESDEQHDEQQSKPEDQHDDDHHQQERDGAAGGEDAASPEAGREPSSAPATAGCTST